MDLLSTDIKDLVENLGVKNIVLGGISMGGYVAFAYRRLFPEDIQALILVDTKAEADTPQARLGRMEMAGLVVRKGVASFADRMLPRLFSKRNVETNTSIVKDARRTIEAMSPIGIVGGLKGLADRSDSTPLLGAIRVPTLIVVGENDELTTVDDAQRMASRIVGSKLLIVPKAAHISTLEQPAKATSTIRAFRGWLHLPHRARLAS